MISEPSSLHRRSIRMPGYDYREEGGYFVTLLVSRRRRAFGRVENGETRLSAYGQIAQRCWMALPDHFPHVVLDEFVVMPNHFHGILRFVTTPVGAQHAAPLHLTPHVTPGSLGAVVRSFKFAVTRQANLYRTERNLSPTTIWQRNYYERIIRDEKELHETQRYIIENPLYWEQDELYKEL